MRRRSLIVALGAALAIGAVAAQSASPIADAARAGDRDAVRALLQQGADVNAAHGDGMTALHWAADRGDGAMVAMLAYAGANVAAVTRIGHYTPLHLASRSGSGPAVRALLEAGADVEARSNPSGAAPIHLAAASGDVDALAALLEHGSDVNAVEAEWAQTPLIFAAAFDRTDAIRLLIAHGADADLASRKLDLIAAGEENRAATALQRGIIRAAVPEGEAPPASLQQAAVQAAREFYRTGQLPEPPEAGQGRGRGGRGAMAAPVVQAAPGRGTGSVVPLDLLNDEGPPPAISFKGGMTPLHHAARQGYRTSAAALLDGGADIDRKSGDGHTPLLVALINGQFDLAMLLIERGADPNIVADGNGVAPLWAAINVRWQPRTRFPQPQEMELQQATYLDVLRRLLEAGADPNVRVRTHPWYMVYTGCGNGNCGLTNTAGSTAFWRAAYGTDVEAMRLLVEHGADPNIPTVAARSRRRRGNTDPNAPDPSGLPPVPIGGPGVYPIHAASGVEYGEGFAGNAHRHAPDGWMPSVKFLVEELGADVNARDNDGYNAVHHAAARGDDELILYLVSKGADVTAVSRRGQTTADMANGPVQRVSPFPETVALLEKLGSKNNHNCVSCAP